MNIVDSLVVTLGLDSKDFTNGIKGSTDALAGFATKALSLFGVVNSVEGVINYFKDLHAQLADVGYAARNLGIAGTELSRFGEISRLMGGQAQDAVSSVMDLQASIFNLQYRGQISDGLIMMQRFGVAYLNAAGHMRDFKDIALDAAAAVDRQAKAAGMNQGERLQLAMSFGFTGGIAAAVAQGGKGLEQALSESAVDQKVLTNHVIDGQVKLSQGLIRTETVIAANSAVILNQLTPQILAAVHKMGDLANEALPKVVTAIQDFQNFFKNPPAWVKDIEDAFKSPPAWLKSLETALGPTGSLVVALAALGVAVGAGSAIVAALITLTTAIATSPFKLGAGAVGAAGAGAAGMTGIASKGLQGTIGIGLGGLLGAVTVAMLVAEAVDMALPDKWKDWYDHSLVPSLEPEDEHGNVKDWAKKWLLGPDLLPSATPAAPPTPNAPRPAPTPTAGGTPTAMNGGATSVHIDSMVVNTRATDAYAMVSSMNDALERKLLVANADIGQS